MSAAIEFSVVGASQLEREMAALVASGEDLTEFNDAFGLILESNTIDRFDRETDVHGNRLTPSVRAKTEGGKTLTDSGRYKGSITNESDARSIRVGSNVIYAGPNNQGAVIRAKGGGNLKFKLPGGLGFRSVEQVILPAREVIGFSTEDEQDGRALARDFFPGKAPGMFAGGNA